MAEIYIDGKETKGQIINWTIKYNPLKKGLFLILTYQSGKTFSAEIGRCDIMPTNRLEGNLLIVKGKRIVQRIDEAIEYGGKYVVVKYPENETLYVMKSKNIEIRKASNIKEKDVFSYFKKVAVERVGNANGDKRKIAENVVSQMDAITPYPGTAIHAYLSKKLERTKKPNHFIYPFGVNESQLLAVENAFTSPISIIEGPPGTGKTQTILNIISNILIDNKTVAIISSNNAAVENVYTKLAKNGMDYIVAKLGSNKNKGEFFENLPEKPVKEAVGTVEIQYIDEILDKLKQYLYAKNDIAMLKAEIGEIKIEKKFLKEWSLKVFGGEQTSINKYRIDPQKATKLMAYIDYLVSKKVSLRDRINLLFQFGMIRSGFLDDLNERRRFVYALQCTYYEKLEEEKRQKVQEYEKLLAECDYDQLLKSLTRESMTFLKIFLNDNMPKDRQNFSIKDYKKKFERFLKCYPVIGSSSHSILNSIARGTILDYVIIDEASQQDIIPGILGLACAKNVVVVGDRKQLPHIPQQSSLVCLEEYFDCAKYSLLDSFVEVFGEKVPMSLLKEHYRCHPKIIQFCNKQFYDNELVPMKEDKGESALKLIVTGKGNHTRNNSNLRELESWADVEDGNRDDVGFIAPFNKQVSLAEGYMPEEFAKATIHKFQGRECKEIIFSTVLDKKVSSQKYMDFVDNLALVNVAVSRAENKFTLITGNEVFSKRNHCIAALIRYMKYYGEQDDIHESPVISAFDLLYDEYDKSLEELNKRLDPNDSRFKSEQIATVLLRDVLVEDGYKGLKIHKQVRLIQLVAMKDGVFTDRERDYMYNGSSCDLVVYFELGKSPLAVIEVDGDKHDLPENIERDKLKDSILKKSGIPLLRLKTIVGNPEDKIREFLSDCIQEET